MDEDKKKIEGMTTPKPLWLKKELDDLKDMRAGKVCQLFQIKKGG